MTDSADTGAVYLNVSLDERGRQLNGADRYEIRFDKGYPVRDTPAPS
jgi:hypothetical protein